MTVFRIQKSKYGKDISGNGSEHIPGRWHIAGDFKVLYTAENRSLALLEKIESFTTNPKVQLPKFTLLEIVVPDKNILTVAIAELPKDWDAPDRKVSQQFGMDWLTKNKSLALSVPSIISGDRNILINPQHKDFAFVKVVNELKNLKIDPRLIKTV